MGSLSLWNSCPTLLEDSFAMTLKSRLIGLTIVLVVGVLTVLAARRAPQRMGQNRP